MYIPHEYFTLSIFILAAMIVVLTGHCPIGTYAVRVKFW